MGVIPPEPGFLGDLRALTRDVGALLIFDEVITGFRVGPGGAQARYGIRPDLTTLGKIIGGGMPIGAVGGSTSLMSVFDVDAGEPKVKQSGTFTANPLSTAVDEIILQNGVAFVQVLRRHPGIRQVIAGHVHYPSPALSHGIPFTTLSGRAK